MPSLAGRVAIVTGAASGIGLTCARALAEEGADVVLSDLNGEALAAAADGIGRWVPADVTRPGDCTALVGEAVALHGAVDVLVCSAGIFHATPLTEIAPDEWERVVSVNLTGTFNIAQAALRAMIPRGRGRIVTIGSLAGQTGGLAAGAAYAASKGGVIALTKSIARFGGPHGVTANCVNPGIIETPLIAGWSPDTRDRVVGSTPMGRVGAAEEVAACVVWLASDGASFVTGAHVDVNGGLLMD
jgi:3-oxoacyl-[acyl-carrier protein] reductase